MGARFSITESLKFGLSKTIDHFSLLSLAQIVRWAFWIGSYLALAAFLGGGVMSFRMMIYERGIYQVTNSFSLAMISLMVGGIIGIEIVDSAMSLGFIKMTLDIYDRGRTDFWRLFQEWHLVIKNLLLALIMRFVLMLGFLLFIIPGVFLTVRLLFAYQILVDKEVNPLVAMRISYEITQGHWFKLFSLSFLLLIVNFIGLCALGIGLIFTIPVTSLSYVYVYRALRK